MKSIMNLLNWLAANWTFAMVCLGVITAIGKKIYSYLQLSTQQKIEAAKLQVQEAILRMVTSAEEDFSDWNSAGEIKRSQVIEEVFQTYPILSKVVDQEALVSWIDELIDNALITLREVIEINTEETEEEE